MTPLIIITIK